MSSPLTTIKLIKSFCSILIVLVFSFTSCYKKKDTIANVTVMNANNEAVSGVEVRLFYAVSADSARIDEISTTGGGGTATFNFNALYKSGQAGFAVLDVEVFLTEAALEARISNPSGATPEASGVVKIEEEVENEQTIVCQTCP